MASNLDKIVFPSLSPDHWVFSGERQADKLMASFLASDNSQSYLFAGKINSFGYLVAQYNDNIPQLISELDRVLKEIFSRYFNRVEVEVGDRTQDSSPSRVIIGIYVSYACADDVVRDISQLVLLQNSKFELIRGVISGDTA